MTASLKLSVFLSLLCSAAGLVFSPLVRPHFFRDALNGTGPNL